MKLSTETLMEQLQSKILETDELESEEKPHDYASFGTPTQSDFRWTIKLTVSHWKTFQILKVVNWHLEEAGSFGEELVLI